MTSPTANTATFTRRVRGTGVVRGLVAASVVLASAMSASANPGGVRGIGTGTGPALGEGGYSGDYVPEPHQGLEMQYRFGEALPMDLPFTDSNGMPVKLRDAFAGGRPVVIVMVYFRCPMLCPRVTGALVDTLNNIEFTVGKDFNVLFVSFDHRDKSADADAQKTTDLLTYTHGEEAGVRENWHVWTSRPEHARQLAEALGFPYKYLPDIGEYSHPSVVFVATSLRDEAADAQIDAGAGGGGGGRVSRYLTGLEYPVKDVRLALLEASDGQIGTLWDRLPVWCYHWDPKAGTYTIAAFRIMQVGAALTVVFLGGLLFIMWRRERAIARKAALDTHAVDAGRPPVHRSNQRTPIVSRGTGGAGAAGGISR